MISTTKENIITMSPEQFAAAYAPEAVYLPEGKISNLHDMITSGLAPEDQDAIHNAMSYGGRDDFNLNTHIYACTCKSIQTQKRAAAYVSDMEKAERELLETLRKVQAVKHYYERLAAILASTEKHPAVVLSRNENMYTDHKVTYSLHTGYYDVSLGKLIVNEPIETFAGKEHRDARARFTALVKASAGTRGYEINNRWMDHVKFEDATITA